MKRKTVLFIIMAVLLLAGCHQENTPEQPDQNQQPESGQQEDNVNKKLHLYIDDLEVQVDWQDNDSISELTDLAKKGDIVIKMSRYGGFEQVGSIGHSLTRNDRQITTQPGDIMLYSGNQIVIFHGSNSWSYTPLGKITSLNADQLKELLSQADVTVTITCQ